MKRCAILLLLAALLLLSACSRLVPEEYVDVSQHKVQPEEDTVEIPIVSSQTALRRTLLSWIESGVEHGELRTRNYRSALKDEMPILIEQLRTQEPIAAYAVDYVSYTCEQSGHEYAVTVDFVYRRSALEISAIETVSGTARAQEHIADAMQSFASSLTLKVVNYEPYDYEAYIRQYALENPQSVMEFPTVAVSVYPESGETRIVEIHFGYHSSRETLESMLSSVTTILNSTSFYIRYGETLLSRLELLSQFMLTRFHYTQGQTDTPAYSLLSEGVANDRAFAIVLNTLCRRGSIPCTLVCGEKDGAEYYWNIVELNGQSYHLDLYDQMLRGEKQYALRYDDELLAQGYSWDTELYPACMPENVPDNPDEPDTSDEAAPSDESAGAGDPDGSLEPDASRDK